MFDVYCCNLECKKLRDMNATTDKENGSNSDNINNDHRQLNEAWNQT